ncbi:MAG TPA: ATP-binding protein [Actinomycetes bacterium]|nr:ATP-binding protein [Actinomycetes bacterium]
MAAPVPLARVVLLAGPSGSGKSYVARRSGLPILSLDDFYKEAGDPTLPRLDGAVDWESPDSWDPATAVQVICQLAATGTADVPSYDMSEDRHIGHRSIDVTGRPLFIAEGIFAAEIVADCATRGVLADALCLRGPPLVTFVRRLVRDLREDRKRPSMVLRQGVRLWRAERAIVRRQCALGARPGRRREVEQRIRELATGAKPEPGQEPSRRGAG